MLKALSTKKKMLIALLIVVSICTIVVSTALVTVAYLTSSAAVSNVFTIGNVGITLTETKVDANGKKLDSGEQVDTNTYHLVPNKTYDKDPTLTILPGSENSYIFILVRNDLEAIAQNTTENPSIAQQLADRGWVKYIKASTGWIYTYVGVGNVPDGNAAKDAPAMDDATKAKVTTLGAGSYTLFTEFSIPAKADVSTYGAAKITITAVAIQNAGFENNVDLAWKAVHETYPYIATGN